MSETAWYKVDNVAKVFLATHNQRDTRTLRVSVTLNETINPEALQYALDQTIKSRSQFQMRIRRGIFWNYLEKTDGGKGFKNPVGISTGEYPDESDMDERYWASVELFKATGDKKYLDYANKQIKETVLTGYGWIEMGSYGDIAYLSMKASDQDKECVSLIEKEIVSQADTFLENAKEDGYGCRSDI